MCRHDVMNIQHSVVNLHGIRCDSGPGSARVSISRKRAFRCGVYSQAKGCTSLGGDFEQQYGMCKYDVVHKTGST